jgi:hypothetical protein
LAIEVAERNGKRYYKIDNLIYPSVTTVLSIVRSPALEHWRGEVGNVEADRIRDEAADIGTQLHRVCHLFNSCQPFAFPDSQVEQMFAAYHEWYSRCVEEVIAAETVVWSIQYGYAGTFDLLAVLKGDKAPSVIDLKTSKDFWPAQAVQLSAYREALLEQGKKVNRRLVVRIDRTEQGKLVIKEFTEHKKDFIAFLNCLGLWRYFDK